MRHGIARDRPIKAVACTISVGPTIFVGAVQKLGVPAVGFCWLFSVAWFKQDDQAGETSNI